MKKFFFITWALLLFLTLFVIVCAKNRNLGSKFIRPEPPGIRIGDLYAECLVDDFKETIPLDTTEDKDSLQEADIIIFGDSFFRFGIGSANFPYLLKQKTGLKICPVASQFVQENGENPLAFLISSGYRKGRRKILLLESVDRMALPRALKYQRPRPFRCHPWRNKWDRFKRTFFTNDDLEYFFKNNTAVFPLRRWIANFRFKYFGEIAGTIGAYSINPKMLFLSGSTKFFFQPKSERDLDTMTENISLLAGKIKEKFNIDLIYLVIPNKFTIYHDLGNARQIYDDFIPRINRKLKKENIAVIDAYNCFVNRRLSGNAPLLYYGSDTHFTPFGKNILLEETVKRLNAFLKKDYILF